MDSKTMALVMRLRPIDDVFARRVFRDNLPLAQRVLRTVTGMGDLELVEEETQRDVRALAGSRSIVLDVWGTDSRGRVHDLEFQTGSAPDPKRLRYHSAAMDVDALPAGRPFGELPEQWVVFVMEHDPYGLGLPTYDVGRTVRQSGMPFGDGTHILYANGDYRGDDAMGSLMRDLAQSDPREIRDDLLRERVEYLKTDRREVVEMGSFTEELLAEGRAEGRVEGRAEGAQSALLENVRSIMETLGLSAQQALDALRVPDSERAQVLSLL